MKFLADIGNSQVKIAISKDEKITKIKTFSLGEINLIKQHIINICKKEKSSLLYSSVVSSDFEDKFRDFASKIFIKVNKFIF